MSSCGSAAELRSELSVECWVLSVVEGLRAEMDDDETEWPLFLGPNPITRMSKMVDIAEAFSQFTLFASTKKGNRPSYSRSPKPEIAVPLYEAFLKQLEADLGKTVQRGEFRRRHASLPDQHRPRNNHHRLEESGMNANCGFPPLLAISQSPGGYGRPWLRIRDLG